MSYELIHADTQGMGELPFTRNPAWSRSRFRRGRALRRRRLVSPQRRMATTFYGRRPVAPLFNSGFGSGFPSQVTTPTLAGLEFSLRPPRWLRRIRPLRVLKKVAKIGAIVAVAAVAAPAAAGHVVRAGGGALKGAKLLARVGGKTFKWASGAKKIGGAALRQKSSWLKAAAQRQVEAATAPESDPVDVSIPVPSSMVSESAPAPMAMTASGPAVPDFSDEAGAPTQAGVGGGMSPALIVGGLVLGGLMLARGRKRGGS